MVKKCGKVLAEGEATGHKHTFLKTEVIEREDGVREFRIEDSDVLTHQEHKIIPFTKETYESGRVNEFDHFTEEARKVQD